MFNTVANFWILKIYIKRSRSIQINATKKSKFICTRNTKQIDGFLVLLMPKKLLNIVKIAKLDKK